MHATRDILNYKIDNLYLSRSTDRLPNPAATIYDPILCLQSFILYVFTCKIGLRFPWILLNIDKKNVFRYLKILKKVYDEVLHTKHGITLIQRKTT